ncbi:MAG: septal ring lytic transglycosylase RlpA family protein, partial [Terriglobia bacterium]
MPYIIRRNCIFSIAHNIGSQAGTVETHSRARKAAIARAGLALGAVLFLTGCLHRRRAKTPLPPTGIQGVQGSQTVQKQDGMRGVASWYGRPYNGRPTSSGEIYNMYAMTAAHRTLPFGTMV